MNFDSVIEPLLSAYVAIIVVAMVLIGIFVWRQIAGQRQLKRFERLLSQRYMRIVTAIMLSEEQLPMRFPMINHRGAKETLVRVLVAVAQSIYGPDIAIIGAIVAGNGLDEWLLRKVRRSRGFVRAHYLSLLAALPLSSEIVGRLSAYSTDRNRFVRFYTLLVRIGGDASSALRALAEYEMPLTGFEIVEIVALLRRGLLPVACEPLLVSSNRNLQIVGINIVREFGIEEVRPMLLEIAASNRDREVAQEALYALVDMHSSLTHRKIAYSVRHLADVERRQLCHRLAYEGYSASLLGYLFGGREQDYAELLVATYKRRIVCMPQ